MFQKKRGPHTKGPLWPNAVPTYRDYSNKQTVTGKRKDQCIK